MHFTYKIKTALKKILFPKTGRPNNTEATDNKYTKAGLTN